MIRPHAWRMTTLIVLLTITLVVVAEPVTLNLRNADIQSLISTVSGITGRNFIVDPRVKGKVTVIASKPMDQEEVYQIFLSVLRVHGFAAVPSGSVTKIVPEANAKQDAIPMLNQGLGNERDQSVTLVIPLENVNAALVSLRQVSDELAAADLSASLKNLLDETQAAMASLNTASADLPALPAQSTSCR